MPHYSILSLLFTVLELFVLTIASLNFLSWDFPIKTTDKPQFSRFSEICVHHLFNYIIMVLQAQSSMCESFGVNRGNWA